MFTRKVNFPLLSLLLLGLIIRIVNCSFGYPILYVVPDEVSNYLSALEMIASRRITTFSHYPVLGSYILVPFFLLYYVFCRLTNKFSSLTEFIFFLATHEGALLFIPRLLSAIFGTLTAFIIYKIAELTFPKLKKVKYWSVILILFSITHLQHSHLGKPWIISVFFSSLGIFYLYKSVLDTKKKNLFILLSSLSFSLACGFHFSAVFYFILFLIILIFIHKINFSKKNLIPFISLFIPLVSFIFYKSVKIDSFIPHHEESLSQLRFYLNNGLFLGFFWYIKELFLTEPILWLFYLLSLILYKNLTRFDRLVLLFSIIYFCIFAFGYFQSVHYLLQIFPIFSVFSAYGIVYYTDKFKVNQMVLAIIFLLITIPSLLWLSKFLKKPTFIKTAEWISHNIPKDLYLGYVETRYAAFTPAINSINIMQRNYPQAYLRLKSLLQNKPFYPDNVREVIYLEKVTNVKDKQKLIEYLKKSSISYVVQYYWDPDQKILYPEDFDSAELVYKISPFKNNFGGKATNLIHILGNIFEIIKSERLGPYMEVLKIKKNLISF